MAHSWLCFIGHSLGRPFLTPTFLIPVPYSTIQPFSTVLRSTHHWLPTMLPTGPTSTTLTPTRKGITQYITQALFISRDARNTQALTVLRTPAAPHPHSQLNNFSLHESVGQKHLRAA